MTPSPAAPRALPSGFCNLSWLVSGARSLNLPERWFRCNAAQVTWSRERVCVRSPSNACPGPAFCHDLQPMAPLCCVPSPEPANTRPCDGSRLNKIGASWKMINVLLDKMVPAVCLTLRESSLCQGRRLWPPARGNYRAAWLEISKDCVRPGILGSKRGGLDVA